MRHWLEQSGFSGNALEPASSDASFRRYFRLRRGDESFIVMDAPPSREDSLPFIRVAGYLEAMDLNAPRVLEADPDNGFLLLTDLGDLQYLDSLENDKDGANSLYRDAINALLRMQVRGLAYQAELPPYDDTLLRFELSLFHDWLCEKHVGIEFDDGEERDWQATCDLLVANAVDQPQVFVHRDYHSRNLMVVAGYNPGILDFQDAVEGPLTYDLVSLLKDCYIRWPTEQVRRWLNYFYRNLDGHLHDRVDERTFRRHFDLMGVQRHLKAAGIFCRLNHRDGKPAYLADIPRTLGYIVDVAADYGELGFLASMISERCLPAFGSGS